MQYFPFFLLLFLPFSTQPQPASTDRQSVIHPTQPCIQSSCCCCCCLNFVFFLFLSRESPLLLLRALLLPSVVVGDRKHAHIRRAPSGCFDSSSLQYRSSFTNTHSNSFVRRGPASSGTRTQYHLCGPHFFRSDQRKIEHPNFLHKISLPSSPICG